MKQKVFYFLIAAFMLGSATVYGQNFKAMQASQEKVVKSAYKKKQITQTEYEKLMMEQHDIKETIKKYDEDGVLTTKEKNALHGKLDKAGKRLEKYKTNSEQY